jgi:hypothetical protein
MGFFEKIKRTKFARKNKDLLPIIFIKRFLMGKKYVNSIKKGFRKWLFTSKEDTNFTYKLTENNIQYLAQMISFITKRDTQLVYSYIIEPINDNEFKDFIINKTKKSKFSYKADYRVDFGRRLGWYCFARIIKPKIIVETGIDKGLGSILLCRALQKNSEEGFFGRYYGTDINKDAGYLLDGVYKNFGEILYGDSIESLKKFDEKIDIFINDSDHNPDYEYNEYLIIKEKLSANGVILGDNSDIFDTLSKFSKETGRNFLYFKEEPIDHFYYGGGIGISFTNIK